MSILGSTRPLVTYNARLAEVQSGPLPGVVGYVALAWSPPPDVAFRRQLGSEGAYLGPRVRGMPPGIQIGAFVDEGLFNRLLWLIGLCAQIGRGVHIGSSSTVGGYSCRWSPPTTLEDKVIWR